MIYILWKRKYSRILKIVLNFTEFIIIIQVFIGLFLMFIHFFSLNKIDIVEILKQKKIRFKLIEHPIMMTIGFFTFILFCKELHKNKKITHTVLFLFLLSLLSFIFRFPFNLI
jgi:hypothetical protein